MREMAGLMTHRGPDGEGFWLNGPVGLGHRRLSIIDLSERGRQPMSNEDGTIWVTFNGEIYNYQELKKELDIRHQFKSASDTEILLHGYEEWGLDLLKRLRGMFAFALYDGRQEKLFLATDHAGQKPLYYFFDEDKKIFYFSSEIKPILEASQIPRRINLKALHLYFIHNWRHIPHPHTIIENIYKLEPSSYLVLDLKTGKWQVDYYWRPDFSKVRISAKKLMEDYRTIAKKCISLVSVSDVPIAVSLSGGVDTSTIVALMDNPSQLHTYSIGFNRDDPELQRARQIATAYKTIHQEIIFDKESFSDLERLIEIYGEPLNLLPALHLYKISERAKKDVKVLIGGNGADEIFYGYDGTARLRRVSVLLDLFGWLWPSLKNKLKGNLYRRKGNYLKNNLYLENVRSEIGEVDEGAIIDRYSRESNSSHWIEKSYYSGLMTENQHSVTIIADLAGMANSVEVRAPFLDHKMIEFASSLPVKFKAGSWFGRRYNKYIMKRSMEGILPNNILYAPKMGLGYNIKIGRLIVGDWRSQVEEILFSFLPQINIFNINFIKEKFIEHEKGEADNSALLWGLVVFGVWHKKFIAKI